MDRETNEVPEDQDSKCTDKLKDAEHCTKISEDSNDLEERYNKLKALAINLKKKLSVQTKELHRVEEENVRLTEKCQKVSKIQLEYDKAQDEIEGLKKSNDVLQNDLKCCVNESMKLKEENIELSGQLNTISHSHKFLRDRVEQLEREEKNLEELKKKNVELEDELSKFKDSAVDAETEKKQSAILSLELTNYRKKLEEAHSELNCKNEMITGLEEKLGESERNNEKLTSNVQSLEEKILEIQTSKENLQGDLARKTDKVNYLHEEMEKLNDRFQEKKSELSRIEQEYENAKVSFSSESKDFSVKLEQLHKQSNSLEQKVSFLQENKRNKESQINNLKLELQQLETEYKNYKQKAQAMLKSQKSSSESIAKTAEADELENLQRIVQDYYSETSILKSDLQTLKLENENLSLEKGELNVRFNKMKSEMLEQDIQLNNEIQRLKRELRGKDEEIKSKCDAFRSEKDVLVASYKGQIDALCSKHEEQINGLREKLEMIEVSGIEEQRSTLKVLPSNNHSVSITPFTKGKETSPPEVNTTSSFKPISSFTSHDPRNRNLSACSVDTSQSFGQETLSLEQLKYIPRGECEGSESVSSPRNSVPNYNISFEQLLNSDIGDKLEEKPSQNIMTLQEDLLRTQNQVNHVTALLRESEANNERLAQLSEALKEEIRRAERERDRKEHLKENTEYLKNVLLKFITLNGEDERLRLVPVLTTMLRLTKDETTKLESSVKVSNAVDSAKWSSYLGIWGSGSGR